MVELYELQLSINKALLQSMGLPERKPSFVLRHAFSSNIKSPEITFNGKDVQRQVAGKLIPE